MAATPTYPEGVQIYQDGTAVDSNNPLATTATISGGITVTPGGTITVVQPTGTNLHAVIDSGTVGLNAGTNGIGSVINNGGSVTVSGTANAVLQVGTTNVGPTNPVPTAPATNGYISGQITASSTATTQLIALSASNHLYGTSFIVSNPGTVAYEVIIQDGSAGTTIAVIPAPAGGGSVGSGNIFFRSSTGNAIWAALTVATTVKITCAGFASPN
jgi:hypothetical protein